MLIYSENRYISTETNMMIIRAKDNNGYYYVHRGLYDQAVILSDMYSDDYKSLCEVLRGKEESRPDVDLFVDTLPTPINILGCFLLLVEEELTELRDMVGAIHVMSNSINFRKMITFPMEMRSNVEFSLTIREEYELPWDRFFKESIPWTPDLFTGNTVAPMSGTQTVEAREKKEEEYSCVGSNGVEYASPLEAVLYGDDIGDDFWDAPDNYGEEEEDEEDENDTEDESAQKTEDDIDAIMAAMLQQAAEEADAEEKKAEKITINDKKEDPLTIAQPKFKDGKEFLRGLA